VDDKEIKRRLKDASLWLADAAKRWPKHKDIARNNLKGGMEVIDSVWDEVMVNRTSCGEEETHILQGKPCDNLSEEDVQEVLGSMVNGF
jgi:hypothetical protein